MGRVNEQTYSFSHSEMTTFKRCKRKWYLHYYLGLRRKYEGVSRARDTGVLVHACLYQFYVAGGLDGPNSEELAMTFLENARDSDLLKVPEEERKAITDVHDTSKILVAGYFEWLHETGADIGYRFENHEVELRAPGPVDGTEIMGILDLAGTHEMSGDLFVADTKVTASFETMLKTLHIQEQGPMYAVLSKINDPNPDRGFRVIWNMIKNNKQTKRAKPPFYMRYELAINADQLRQFYSQLHGQVQDILRTEERLNNNESHISAAYPTPMQDCAFCQFFSVCSIMNDMTRNDVDFAINVYYTSPEQREQQRIDAERDQRTALSQGEEESSVPLR